MICKPDYDTNPHCSRNSRRMLSQHERPASFSHSQQALQSLSTMHSVWLPPSIRKRTSQAAGHPCLVGCRLARRVPEWARPPHIMEKGTEPALRAGLWRRAGRARSLAPHIVEGMTLRWKEKKGSSFSQSKGT